MTFKNKMTASPNPANNTFSLHICVTILKSLQIKARAITINKMIKNKWRKIGNNTGEI